MEKMFFSSASDERPSTPSPQINLNPSPPPAPVKPSSILSRPATPKPSEIPSNTGSPYIAAHIGDPCTLNALDHLLNCDHKIITHQPELCASNCCGNYGSLANPRGLDQGFACLACITKAQPAKHDERVKSFREELEQVAKITMKPFPKHWIETKLEVISQAWKDVAADEMLAEARKGRFCCAFYVDPEHEEAVAAMVEKRMRDKGRKQDAAAKALVDGVSA